MAGGPILLGDDPALARVDPMWRASPVPYGPLTLLLLRAITLAQGDLVTGVLLLRLVALLGVAAGAAVALRLTPHSRRPYVFALCALNPITLVHLVGGAHVDAVLGGVVALSLLALHLNRPYLSWLLATSAVAVKITAAPLLVFVMIGLVRQCRGRMRMILAASTLASLPYAAAFFVVDRPWGFLAALTVPGASSPWYAPANMVGDLLVGGSRLLSIPVDENAMHGAGRLVALLGGGLVVVSLLRSALNDGGPSNSRWALQRIAVALLVVVLCLPALYAWYLAAGLFVLAAVGTRRWTLLVVALSSALSFSSLPSLYAANRWPLAGAWCVAGTILVVGFIRSGRMAGVSSKRVASTTTEASGPGHRGLLRLAQLAGVGLLAPLAFGLLSPGARADVAVVQAQSERMRVVAQLTEDYPGRQIVSVLPTTGPDATYTVELARPGGTTCRLLLARGVGPYAPFVRPEVDSAERARSADHACPPPDLIGPARPDHLDPDAP